MTRQIVVFIKERIQAGDSMLLRYDCPRCCAESLQGYPLSACVGCGLSLAEAELDLSRHRRVLVGTTRKRAGLSKRVTSVVAECSGWCCSYCGQECRATYHIDHIVPLAVGGTNRIENLALACPRCNLIAGAKYFNTFAAKRAYILDRRQIKGDGNTLSPELKAILAEKDYLLRKIAEREEILKELTAEHERLLAIRAARMNAANHQQGGMQ